MTSYNKLVYNRLIVSSTKSLSHIISYRIRDMDRIKYLTTDSCNLFTVINVTLYNFAGAILFIFNVHR